MNSKNHLIEELKTSLDSRKGIILYGDAIKTCIEALEKQVPKKPFQPFGTHSFKCPSCCLFIAHEVDDNVDLESEMAEYCPYCGQKLDWSE